MFCHYIQSDHYYWSQKHLLILFKLRIGVSMGRSFCRYICLSVCWSVFGKKLQIQTCFLNESVNGNNTEPGYQLYIGPVQAEKLLKLRIIPPRKCMECENMSKIKLRDSASFIVLSIYKVFRWFWNKTTKSMAGRSQIITA